MKIKTSELIDHALDWAVAKCESRPHRFTLIDSEPHLVVSVFQPSTDWSQGGPVIEREGIDISKGWHAPGTWTAWPNHMNQTPEPMHGPTPLIAAMRCYVASKMGDEVEVPEELC
jgi:hypothetical protein